MRFLPNQYDPRQIEAAIRDPRDRPLGLFPVDDVASLPDATHWPYALLFVVSLGTAALSDGSYWYPIELGAAVFDWSLDFSQAPNSMYIGSIV